MSYRNRENNELDLSGLDNKTRDYLTKALEKETLLVSLGAKLKVAKLLFLFSLSRTSINTKILCFTFHNYLLQLNIFINLFKEISSNFRINFIYYPAM